MLVGQPLHTSEITPGLFTLAHPSAHTASSHPLRCWWTGTSRPSPTPPASPLSAASAARRALDQWFKAALAGDAWGADAGSDGEQGSGDGVEPVALPEEGDEAGSGGEGTS